MRNLLSILMLLALYGTANAQDKLVPDTWAVIIGVSDYQDIKDLKFAHRDAIAFYDFLTSEAGGTVDSNNITLLLNEEANIGNIMSALEWLKVKAESGDQVYIYFSGHGDAETVTETGFLLTHNTSKEYYFMGGFSMEAMDKYIKILSQKGANIVFIADACRSGELKGGDLGSAQTAQQLQTQWANEIKMLSCQPEQVSIEDPAFGGGRGVFSYHLIEGLQGLADYEGDRNNRVSLAELMMYLMKYVPKSAFPEPQNPIVTGNMQSTLAFVEAQTLAALIEEKEKSPTLAMASASKGMSEELANELDEVWKVKYDQFQEYLQKKASLKEEGPSAYTVYEEFKSEGQWPELIGQMERQLSAGLQNEVQEVINKFLGGHWKDWVNGEWVSRTNGQLLSLGNFDLAAQKIEKILEIYPHHPLYDVLLSRQLFLEGQQLAESTDQAELHSAIEKLQKSIELEPHAAYSYYTLGNIYYKLKDYDDAILYLEKAAEMAPGWNWPSLSLGNIFFDRKDYFQAEKLYLAAIEINPENIPHTYNNLGMIYRLNGQYDKALEYNNKAIANDSSFANAYFHNGLVYEDLGDTEMALKAYEQAITADAWFADPYYYSGMIHHTFDSLETAKYYYSMTVEVDEDYSEAYAQLGNIAITEDSVDLAQLYFLAATVKDSTYAYPIYMLGSIAEDKEEIERAIGLYKLAIETDPEYQAPLRDLGVLYHNELRYTEAKEAYLQYLQLDSSIAYIYYNLGLVYDHFSQNDSATIYFEKSLELNPEYILPLQELALIAHNGENYNQAKEYYTRYLSLDTTADFMYYNLGIVYESLSQPDSAVLAYLKALEISPGYEDALIQLGYIYLYKEDFQRTEDYFNRAIQENPEAAEYYYHLACLYSLKGEPDKGLQSLKIALEKGFSDFEHLASDPDMENVRTHSKYQDLVEQYK